MGDAAFCVLQPGHYLGGYLIFSRRHVLLLIPVSENTMNGRINRMKEFHVVIGHVTKRYALILHHTVQYLRMTTEHISKCSNASFLRFCPL